MNVPERHHHHHHSLRIRKEEWDKLQTGTAESLRLAELMLGLSSNNEFITVSEFITLRDAIASCVTLMGTLEKASLGEKD